MIKFLILVNWVASSSLYLIKEVTAQRKVSELLIDLIIWERLDLKILCGFVTWGLLCHNYTDF